MAHLSTFPSGALVDLVVIWRAAKSGNNHASAWLRGEGRIVITPDLQSRFIRWDNQSERSNPQYAIWRSTVYRRDSYRCRECDSGSFLVAHHIKSWADYPELRFSLDNGITLCEDCHVKQHPHLRGLLTWRKKRKTGVRQN